MIDPSLRGLHWLAGGGARVHFCIKKAYISGLGGHANGKAFICTEILD